MTSPVSGLRHWWTHPSMWRFAPLYAGLWLADHWPVRRTPWPRRERDTTTAPGLSIVIPERGTPDRLQQTLQALLDACKPLDEPYEIIVLVNGVDRSGYRELETMFTAATWHYVDEPLGYGRAIGAALGLVRHAWCYLLNSDMVLAPDALTKVLAYRRPEVFAVASQIFFVDPQRRREETGWGDFHTREGHAELYDRTPEADPLVRAHLYAGGGSSLYRTALLRRYVRTARDYAPFYWEDADWGARAWAEGWQVLFCPESHAHHHHRSTIGKYYEPAEIDRIVRRNAVLFDLRNGLSGQAVGMQFHRIAALPKNSRRELSGWRLALRAVQARSAVNRARAQGLHYHGLCSHEWHSNAVAADGVRRPRVLLVSPFAVYPPAHGGARRIAELIEGLAERYDIILLSDERSAYGEASKPWYRRLYAVHLVEGRQDGAGEAALPLAARIDRHAWSGLRTQLKRLIAVYAPDIVQVEFTELARLVEDRDAHARWAITLHDVEAEPYPAGSDLHALLQRYDQVVACTEADRRRLAPLPATLVANGARDRRTGATRSPDHHLLFLGPFRYEPNRSGILAFLERCWPGLKQRFPALRLTILCATAEPALVGHPLFAQAGVELRGAYEDPAAWLAQCSLTINPLTDVLGSSVKLVESLLARRICISTRDGARGFADDGIDGLVVVPDIDRMLEPIAALLDSPALRHAQESRGLERLDRYTWQYAAGQLEDAYTRLLEA